MVIERNSIDWLDLSQEKVLHVVSKMAEIWEVAPTCTCRPFFAIRRQ
jgi:hypothetical protein